MIPPLPQNIFCQIWSQNQIPNFSCCDASSTFGFVAQIMERWHHFWTDLHSTCILYCTDLCGTDDGFPRPVTSTNHHLLGQEHLLWGNLNAKVTSGHHDTIRLLQDLVKSVTIVNIIKLIQSVIGLSTNYPSYNHTFN